MEARMGSRILSLSLVAACLSFAPAGCYANHGLNERADAAADTSVPEDMACPPRGDAGSANILPIELPFSVQTRLTRADVLFLLDVTGSMGGELAQIQASLRDVIAPGIQASVPDVEFGVATFADFPEYPYGVSSDVIFSVERTTTADLSAVQSALDAIELGSGLDQPEAQVEALYQSATGEGLPGVIPRAQACPAGRFGYPCFRDDALPLVFLFTDAPFHNDRGGINPYDTDIVHGAHSYGDTLRVLREQGMHVISFWSGDELFLPDQVNDARNIASETGAITSAGFPMLFSIGEDGQALDASVLEAIQTFAGDVGLDIGATATDPNPSDGIDVLSFVDSVDPLRAVPNTGVRAVDHVAHVFRRAVSGTQVTFQLRLRAGAFELRDAEQRYEIEITFRADNRVVLDRQRVTIVVPARASDPCGVPVLE